MSSSLCDIYLPFNLPMNSAFQPIVPSTSGPAAGTLSAGNSAAGQFEALDIYFMADEIRNSLEYFTETRGDFEKYGAQPWIDELSTLLLQTKQAVRDMEVTHISDLVEWKDDEGKTHQVILRTQAPTDFDPTVRLFLQAQEQFDRYFKKHVLLLRKEKELQPHQYYQ